MSYTGPIIPERNETISFVDRPLDYKKFLLTLRHTLRTMLPILELTVHYEDEVQVKQGLVYALGMVNGQLALLGTGPLENEETEG